MALWDWCRPMWILETNMKIRHACKRSSKSREARAEAPKVRSCISKRLEHPITEETLALCLDMYTDDFWKHSYLDIHVNWVDNSSHHMALALWDVGHLTLHAQKVAVCNIHGCNIQVNIVYQLKTHGSQQIMVLMQLQDQKHVYDWIVFVIDYIACWKKPGSIPRGKSWNSCIPTSNQLFIVRKTIHCITRTTHQGTEAWSRYQTLCINVSKSWLLNQAMKHWL